MGQSSTAGEASYLSALLQKARDYYLNAKPKTWAAFLTENKNSLQLWRLYRDDGQPSHAFLISNRISKEIPDLNPENIQVDEHEGILQCAVRGQRTAFELAKNLQPYDILYVYHGHTNQLVALILGRQAFEAYYAQTA